MGVVTKKILTLQSTGIRSNIGIQDSIGIICITTQPEGAGILCLHDPSISSFIKIICMKAKVSQQFC